MASEVSAGTACPAACPGGVPALSTGGNHLWQVDRLFRDAGPTERNASSCCVQGYGTGGSPGHGWPAQALMTTRRCPAGQSSQRARTSSCRQVELALNCRQGRQQPGWPSPMCETWLPCSPSLPPCRPAWMPRSCRSSSLRGRPRASLPPSSAPWAASSSGHCGWRGICMWPCMWQSRAQFAPGMAGAMAQWAWPADEAHTEVLTACPQNPLLNPPPAASWEEASSAWSRRVAWRAMVCAAVAVLTHWLVQPHIAWHGVQYPSIDAAEWLRQVGWDRRRAGAACTLLHC